MQRVEQYKEDWKPSNKCEWDPWTINKTKVHGRWYLLQSLQCTLLLLRLFIEAISCGYIN